MNTNAPSVLLRLGSHAEKDYFLKTAGRFDGLVLGANLLESTAGATASLVCRLCSNGKGGIPYFVDPMTYAFGTYFDPEVGSKRADLDWIKSDQKKAGRQFKRSYRNLASELGSPFGNAIGRNRAVQPEEMIQTGAVAGVLEYQATRITRTMEKDPELREFIGLVPPPAALLTPYFYQEPSSPSFDLDCSLELIRLSLEYKSNIPIHAVICGDIRHLSNNAYLDKLIRGLKQLNPPGVWLWFSKFDEYKATVAELSGFRDLVRALRGLGTLVNMHGSFLSLALWRSGLTGLMHGVGYGEQKDVVPVIGQSTPWVSFYLPPCRSRLSVPNIQRCFRTLGIRTPADFHSEICDCVICKGVLRGDIENFKDFGDTYYSSSESKKLSQTPAAAKRCRYHFLLVRLAERDFVSTRTEQEIAASLNNAHSTWSGFQHMKDQISHLTRWSEVLRG